MKKKILEISLHDNGRAECHLEHLEGDDVKRFASVILSLMSRNSEFAEIITACANIYRLEPEMIDKITDKAIDAAQKVN